LPICQGDRPEMSIPYAHGRAAPNKRLTICAISTTNDIAGRFTPAPGFDQLTGHFGYSLLGAIPAGHETSEVAGELQETSDAFLDGVRSAVECRTACLKAEQTGRERS